VAWLANHTGRIASADSFARGVGLHSRHSLARLLKREGLPQIEELCGWISTLALLSRWEHTHSSLYSLALDTQRSPPTCYRAVKRVTGKTWRQACSEGFSFMLVSFVNRCREVGPGTRAKRQTATGT